MTTGCGLVFACRNFLGMRTTINCMWPKFLIYKQEGLKNSFVKTVSILQLKVYYKAVYLSTDDNTCIH